MFVYYIYLFLILVVYLLSIFFGSSKAKIFLILYGVITVAFLGFRGYGHVDGSTYFSMYEDITPMFDSLLNGDFSFGRSETAGYEYGYAVFMSLMKSIYSTYWFHRISYASFSIIALIYAFYLIDQHCIGALLIASPYLLMECYFHQYRSGLAISLAFLGLALWINKNHKQSTFSIFFAVNFHSSVISTILVPLVSRISEYVLFALVTLGIVFHQKIDIINFLSVIFSSQLSTDLYMYRKALSMTQREYYFGTASLYTLGTLKYYLVAFVGLIFRKAFKDNYFSWKYIYSAYMLGFLFHIIFIDIWIIGSRISRPILLTTYPVILIWLTRQLRPIAFIHIATIILFLAEIIIEYRVIFLTDYFNTL
jgi:hypothetical protein